MGQEELEPLDNLPRDFNKNSEGLYKIYDRFSFDSLFRLLLNNDFEHEEALSFVLNNCSLSALVFQERIYNKYYLNISLKETVSEDLINLRGEVFEEILTNIWKESEKK
jgi:hypothetical protein